jgi:uncharacterized membrane protein
MQADPTAIYQLFATISHISLAGREGAPMPLIFGNVTSYLVHPLTLAGLAILGILVIARFSARASIESWPPTLHYRLLRSFFLGGLGITISLLLVTGGIGVRVMKIGFIKEATVVIQGKLNITDAKAFLEPDPNQALTGSTLMMMKNIPPGGTSDQRIDAAPSYFTVTRKKPNGSHIEVTGTIQALGSTNVLVIEQ